MEPIQTTKGNNYMTVEYNGKQYIVGYTPFKNNHILFVFDADDKDKVVQHRWYYKHNIANHRDNLSQKAQIHRPVANQGLSFSQSPFVLQ